MTTEDEHLRRPSSRIPGFYDRPLDERLTELVERGVLSDESAAFLRSRSGGVPTDVVDNMVENAIGVLELPLGLGLNFVINGRDYIVPMAIEEPSVIAGVSHVANLVRRSGGFDASSDATTMIGQIQVTDVPDLEVARRRVAEATEELVALANSFDEPLRRCGGGAHSIETRVLAAASQPAMLIVHLYVDCVDAMGANAVNTMVEGLAPRVEELTGGSVFLRILSNLADRRTARASCRIPVEHLDWHGFEGRDVARGIALASAFAEADPYRAATHNKGVMNGVSAVCIATGNDWRAVEAGAHAFAARSGHYGPLATWRVEGEELVGTIEIPVAVGTIGGPIRIHPTVQIVHEILRVSGARELGEVMAAVGLAQNMAALKALATEGIQRGHMSLHARSVALSAGAREDELTEVVAELVACGDVKIDRAREILRRMRR